MRCRSLDKAGKVEIVSEGAAPTAVTLLGTSDLGATSVARQFPGAAVTDVDLPADATETSVWFDAVGSPHLRQASGKYIVDLDTDAVISVSGGHAVVVHRSTGLIER